MQNHRFPVGSYAEWLLEEDTVGKAIGKVLGGINVHKNYLNQCYQAEDSAILLLQKLLTAGPPKYDPRSR